MRKITLYDTTLRDGTQAEDISFSAEDKVRITERLDELGIHYVEGGWPGSNPKDLEFFERVKGKHFSNLKVTAFGSTRRAGNKPEKDPNLMALLECGVDVTTIFGKTWDLHVTKALGISLEENLDLIGSSIAYLKSRVSQVFYDAEHFFDGFKANADYAIKTLKAAAEAGADCLVLCDTNGGSLPGEVKDAIIRVKRELSAPLGIHTQNDSGLAVANSMVAVEEGVDHIQGTINGIGERCGNANLCTIIPNVQLKMGHKCLSDEQLKKMRSTSRFIVELANLTHNKHQPYVGNSAFAHKGGIHVSAVLKDSETYEHIRPERVGNHQRVLVSDLSGRGNILYKAKAFGIDIDSKDPVLQGILKNLKELENQGFQYEGAEASFEMLMRKARGEEYKFFDLIGFRVIDEKRKEDEPPIAEATIMIKVGGHVEHTASVGNGPVNAIDNALRKALEKFYPELKEVSLIDFKVRVLTAGEGTASSVRVLMESGDGEDKWGTVGVSHNVIEASWQAVVDSINYKLLKEELKRKEQ
ncbi:MAG: citramalate synthase [Deltaproteobacteria bacterium]|nr:citramalate synthase [Deltaproteobacteria bacterium]